MLIETIGGAGVFIAIVVLYFLSCIRFIFEFERGVVFRLGRVLAKPKGPGVIVVFWPIDRLMRISLRTQVDDVPPQDIITRDNVSVKVNAVVYSRVVDPHKAVLEVEDYRYATGQLSQTTLRSILGQSELDELLSERDRINRLLQEIIDRQTDPWGIKVSAVEVKHVDLPETMKRAMARQAESERERRAKVIHAEGEFQAASGLRDAAAIIENYPMAMQMRFLQTVTDLGSERSNFVVLPVPIDLFTSFLPSKVGHDGKPQEKASESSRATTGD